MSGTVKKVFIVLIVVVALIIIGALVLNVLLPNATALMVDYIEWGIYRATGLGLNLNGNAYTGNTDQPTTGVTVTDDDSADVEGWD